MSEEQRRKESAVVKALETLPKLEDLKKSNLHENAPGESYRAIRRVEKAYEELREQGQDVAEELRERRYQLLEHVAEELHTFVNSILVDARGRVKDVGQSTVLNMDGAETAVARIREYLGKLFPQSEALTFEHNYLSDSSESK